MTWCWTWWWGSNTHQVIKPWSATPQLPGCIAGTPGTVCWPLDTYTVLCLATYPGDTSIMASVGEEREARVWRLEQDRLEGLVVGSGHIEALGGLSWGAELSLLV